jgi:hypothetical protein
LAAIFYYIYNSKKFCRLKYSGESSTFNSKARHNGENHYVPLFLYGERHVLTWDECLGINRKIFLKMKNIYASKNDKSKI